MAFNIAEDEMDPKCIEEEQIDPNYIEEEEEMDPKCIEEEEEMDPNYIEEEEMDPRYIDLDTEEDIAKYIDSLNKEEDIARCIDIDRSIAQLEIIENEIVTNLNFIRDSYSSKLGDLECHIPHPTDYALVTKAISNDMILIPERRCSARILKRPRVVNTATEDQWFPIQLKEDLSHAAYDRLMKLFVESTSSKSWKPLPEDVLQMTIKACDCVIALDSEKKKLFEFLESKVINVAPNLCEVVGSGIAAKLMAAAGSLAKLADMPASDIEVLGQQKSDNISFHDGYLESTEIFQTTILRMRKRARQLLAEKLKEAASVDLKGGDVSGSAGRALREDILGTIEYEEYESSSQNQFQLQSRISERKPGPRMRTIEDEIYSSYALYRKRKRG